MARTISAEAAQTRWALVERLEDRRLMSVTLGANLIVNPGAEANAGGTGSAVILPTGWTANSKPTVVKYGTSGFPTAAGPGPATRGANFFAGGPNNTESDLFQSIDLSSVGATIDAGKMKFALEGYLGGFSSQADQATLFVNFQNSSKGFVNQVSVGPVTPANRSNVTGLLLKSLNGTVPATTRFAQVQIHFEALTGGYNDGYADNLSLVLTSGTTTGVGTVSGTVLNDVNGDGVKSTGEVGLGGVKVFFDTNGNGKQDPTETKFTTTAANGTYSFTAVPAGSYNIGEVIPATYRSVGPNPVAITVTGGATAAANFFDSQTVLISGVVFNDANGNKIQDATEKGIAGVVVYLDFNNNGQLDSFELKTTTDSTGHYKFVEPFGTYVVRQVIPTGKIQTTPVTGFTHTLAKGGQVTTDNFGDK